MRTGQSETARVAAATALLDRGYGRPPQAHDGGGKGGGPVKIIHEVRWLDPEPYPPGKE
jgi:hypothetical protein